MPVVADFDSREATTAAANSGKFVGSVGSLNKAARLAVQKGRRQNAVWNEVAKENAKAGVERSRERLPATIRTRMPWSGWSPISSTFTSRSEIAKILSAWSWP